MSSLLDDVLPTTPPSQPIQMSQLWPHLESNIVTLSSIASLSIPPQLKSMDPNIGSSNLCLRTMSYKSYFEVQLST